MADMEKVVARFRSSSIQVIIIIKRLPVTFPRVFTGTLIHPEMHMGITNWFLKAVNKISSSWKNRKT
jgi:hypothetical protein